MQFLRYSIIRIRLCRYAVFHAIRLSRLLHPIVGRGCILPQAIYTVFYRDFHKGSSGSALCAAGFFYAIVTARKCAVGSRRAE